MLDRRMFTAALMSASVGFVPGDAARSTGAAPARAPVHEATEIAWIIAALSPLGRENGGVVRRDTPYFKSVERWFEPVRTHPAIFLLGRDFNLPRLVGNAADYDFDAEGGLLRSPGTTSLWDDPEGDLFGRHAAQIADFARTGRALAFLQSEAAALHAAGAALDARIDMARIQGWLEARFTARPGRVRLFVSPLTDGWNWTNLGGAEPRIWVPAPRPGRADNKVQRFLTVASVFTEVDHIYVNPVSATHGAAIATAFARDRGWATDAAWADYGSAELVFNEYMTWNLFLDFAADELGPADFTALAAKVVTFMESGRGFPKFGTFRDIVGRVQAAEPDSLQAQYPAILAALMR